MRAACTLCTVYAAGRLALQAPAAPWPVSDTGQEAKHQMKLLFNSKVCELCHSAIWCSAWATHSGPPAQLQSLCTVSLRYLVQWWGHASADDVLLLLDELMH